MHVFEHKKEKELMEFELMTGRKNDLHVTLLCAYNVKHAKSLEEKSFFDPVFWSSRMAAFQYLG